VGKSLRKSKSSHISFFGRFCHKTAIKLLVVLVTILQKTANKCFRAFSAFYLCESTLV